MAYDFSAQMRNIELGVQRPARARIFRPRKSARTTRVNAIDTGLSGAVNPPCFMAGTCIATPRGEVTIEQLRPGDRVITRDNGLATLRWVGVRRLSAVSLAGARHLTPVLISKGALGNDLPERDMIVSPNHRLLVSQDKTALHFDAAEALVAAKHLTGLVGVHPMPQADVTYINLVFDAHQIILTNGTWSESFRPLLEGDTQGGNAQRTELLEIYPELAAQRTASARALDSVS